MFPSQLATFPAQYREEEASEEASQAAGGQAPLPPLRLPSPLPCHACLHCGSPDSQLIAALVSITVITIICFHLAPAHFLTRKAACLSPLLCPRMLPTGLPVLRRKLGRHNEQLRPQVTHTVLLKVLERSCCFQNSGSPCSYPPNHPWFFKNNLPAQNCKK